LVDLVAISYNSKEYLINLIRDIKRFTKDYSLTIVDNNSTDGTKDLLAQGATDFCLPICLKKNEGYAVACNRGAFLGQNEYICFLNADLKLGENWLDGMLEDMKKNEWVATGPILLDEHGYPFTQKPNWLSGACFLIKRDIFEEIGGFDENYFFYYEDDDICMKLQQKGYKFGRSGIGIVHLYNRSPKLGEFRVENLNKSKTYFDNKWGIKNDGK
jgi:GT2 family glycosyltransferase